MPDPEKNITAAVEALLFIEGEPVTRKKIAAVLGSTEEAVQAALLELSRGLEHPERGLSLLTAGDKVQLTTKPEFGEIMAQFIKDELSEDLTPASLEALSLILYLGPIPRSRLDYLRGVNSSFIVRNLMLRGLVERVPNPEKPSFFLYQAAAEALRHLGVASAKDLPEYAKFAELAKESFGQEDAVRTSVQ